MDVELEKIAYAYGSICVATKKQRRKRQKLLIKDLLFDYAKNSTLHGLRYIVERGLTIIEKLFWLVTVIASVVICSIYIYNVYHKWVTSPVIVTVNEKLTPVSLIPFPSVTICPQMRVNKTLYDYSEALFNFRTESLNEDEVIQFINVGSMCDVDYGNYLIQNPLTNASYVKDITEVAPNDIFFSCLWYENSTQQDCSYFNKVYTEDGVCYTANSLAANEIFKDNIQTEYKYLDSNSPSVGWSAEDGYDYSVDDFYPRRGRALGYMPDMYIALQHNPNELDKSCNVLYSGYKIYLHHPADYPQSSLYYYAARLDQLTSLAISFHQLNTDKNLVSYDPKIRQCYFQSERPLLYFKIYTANNCQAECLANYTLKICGCVGFYMPHNDSSQICSLRQKMCMQDVKDLMAQSQKKADLKLKEDCRCLPACDSIEYDAEVLKAEYNLQEALKQHYPNHTSENVFSRIDLYFKKSQFMTMQRRELFGVTDMLANIGGLLGVFLGFSFLSLIEIFYFLTFRLGFTLKRDLDEEKLKKMSQSKDVKTN